MSRSHLFLVAGVILAVCLFLASRTTLFDRDEPRFSRAAVEMVRSGNYLYATFNGDVRADKPILIYWLMSIPVRLFGETTLACRMWSPIGAAVAALLTGLIGWRLCGRTMGLLAMGMLATSPLMVISGTAATVDAVLLALIVGSVLTFLHALDKGPTAGHWVALALLTIAAILTKGPAGLLAPVFVIPAAWWLARRQTPLRMTYLLGAAVVLMLGVGAYLAWGIPANNATGGIVLGSGIGKHVIGRATAPMEGHGQGYWINLPFYVIAILVGFAPWTLYLPGAMSALMGGRLCHRLSRPLLIGWAVPIFLLVTAMATKLPHYALPIWPALALAAAGVLAAREHDLLNARDLAWLRAPAWFVLPGALLLAAGLAVGPERVGLPLLQMPARICAVVIVLTAVPAVWLHLKGQYLKGAIVHIVGMGVLWLAVGTWVMPAVEQYKIARPLAAAVNRQYPDLPVAVYEYNEPSLIFYLGREHVTVLQTPAQFASWAMDYRPTVLITYRDSLPRLARQYGDLRLRVIAEAEGFAFGKGRPVDVVALRNSAVEPDWLLGRPSHDRDPARPHP